MIGIPLRELTTFGGHQSSHYLVLPQKILEAFGKDLKHMSDNKSLQSFMRQRVLAQILIQRKI
jgi:hypothetical protein